jgi:hypothetical protein
MREGAFALIDCLGFKGIWKRTDTTLLIRKLLRIEEVVSSEVANLQKGDYKFFSFGGPGY